MGDQAQVEGAEEHEVAGANHPGPALRDRAVLHRRAAEGEGRAGRDEDDGRLATHYGVQQAGAPRQQRAAVPVWQEGGGAKSTSLKVRYGDLKPKQKERVLEVLFAKINNRTRELRIEKEAKRRAEAKANETNPAKMSTSTLQFKGGSSVQQYPQMA